MIEITYDRSEHIVTATGHAQSDEFGKDLICSAVSILMWTLSLNCCNLADEYKNKEGMIIELKPGNSKISIPKAASEDDDNIIRYTFDTLCYGFEFLSREFPEYVVYKEICGGMTSLKNNP